MALITCKDCAHELSTDARSCPHCGALNPQMSSPRHTGWIVLFLVLLTAAPSLWTYLDASKYQPTLDNRYIRACSSAVTGKLTAGR
jgi:hypothetical protein